MKIWSTLESFNDASAVGETTRRVWSAKKLFDHLDLFSKVERQSVAECLARGLIELNGRREEDYQGFYQRITEVANSKREIRQIMRDGREIDMILTVLPEDLRQEFTDKVLRA